MQAVFLDLDSLNPQDLDLTPLHRLHIEWNHHDRSASEQLAERAANAAILVTNKVGIDRATIESLPALRLICVAATGTNNVDLGAASDHAVVVSNARNYATASVAEHVFAMLLTLFRQLDNYRQGVAGRDWAQSPYFCLFGNTIEELYGRTLGIVGYGVLGRAVAERARAFGMQVEIAQRRHVDPVAGRIPLDELLESCDVLSLHCPLTTQTRGLIGAQQLKRMKPGSILVNTARGGIVEEAALLEALQTGQIAGAAVDVLLQEPPDASNPLLQADLPGLLVTPHVAWASRPARQRLLEEIATNINAFLTGSPRNQVNTPPS